MKDFTKEELTSTGYILGKKPPGSAVDLLNFALNALYEDEEKVITDSVADKTDSGCSMTYEELIGVLLSAKACILEDKS